MEKAAVRLTTVNSCMELLRTTTVEQGELFFSDTTLFVVFNLD